MITMTIHNTNAEEDFDLTSSKYYAIPMIVCRKFDGKFFVVLTSYNGVIFFQEGENIGCSNNDYLKNHYKFVRFLTKDESVTFTGER